MLNGSKVDIASKTPGSMDIASGPKLWLNEGWYTGCEGTGFCLPMSGDVWYAEPDILTFDPGGGDVCVRGIWLMEGPSAIPKAVSSLLILFNAEAMTM